MGIFFSHVYHIISRGSPKPPQEESKKNPTKLSLFLQLRTSWDKIHVTFSPNTYAKIPFYFSLRKSKFQKSIIPCQHSCTSCCPLSGLCRHSWQCHHPEGCVTDAVSGTAHVPKPGRHSSLMGISILCSGNVSVLDFQGLGSLWRAVFVVFCACFPLFVFLCQIYQHLFCISSKLLASPPSPPLFSMLLEATSQKRMIVSCATMSCLNMLFCNLQFNQQSCSLYS